jgi:hypothetical protein
MSHAHAIRMIEYEAQSLLERLNEVRPFALTLPMVAAAAPSVAAQAAIEKFLADGRSQLRRLAARFLDWLHSPAGSGAAPSQVQRRYAIVRMRFLDMLTQFDVFADALAERSQHSYGEWLGGLDVLAADALLLPCRPYASPPVICHLDREPGAAIRRVRARLPGGGQTPVAIIRMPRERMVGSAIASSLVHEVGHQGAALLELVDPLRQTLGAIAASRPAQRQCWLCLQAWISEIIADFWSVARVGIASTQGLMSVVSLPAAFVTRFSIDDPHPPPWIRVKISAAIGNALYPGQQWQQLAATWDALYPLQHAARQEAAAFSELERVIPEFAALLAAFRPASLGGLALAQAFPLPQCAPGRLRALWQEQRRNRGTLALLPPTQACAAIGQAKFDGWISATEEVALLRRLLRFWALHSTIDARTVCAQARPSPQALALTV